MPTDFWTQVVQAVATMIFQRETSRSVSIVQQTPIVSYSHTTHKPWHAATPDDAAS